MFYFAKKTIYLSYYEEGRKRCMAGFARLWSEGSTLHFVLRAEKAGKEINGVFPLIVRMPGYEQELGTVRFSEGAGVCEGERKFPWDKLDGKTNVDFGILIKLPDRKLLKGGWEDKEENLSQASKEKEENGKKEEDKEEEEAGKKEEEGKEKEEREKQEQKEKALEDIIFCGSKWEQLLLQYPKVHPFGDERVFISLEPKDFILLREKDQRLVNNSFLLHGFYNYRHVILGQEGRIGNSAETCFYIGVPGVFYEREKMVAVMFGFEGFECRGPVENGKFGYYLRQVEI